MTTHIANFGYTTGQTLTAKLFAIGSDVVAYTAASVTEQTNLKNRYVASFTGVAAGEYLLIYFIGADGVGSEYYTFAGSDGESVLPWSEASQASVADEIERAGGMLALVKAKTDLITAGGVTILSPVAQDGTLNNLVVGDAYQLAAGRAIVITVTNVAAGLQTILQTPGATVHLGFLRYGKTRQNPDFRRYEFAGTIVSVGASTVVRFELTTAQTLGIVPSKYDYDIEFRQNANFVTSVANAKGKPMEWLESATELA